MKPQVFENQTDAVLERAFVTSADARRILLAAVFPDHPTLTYDTVTAGRSVRQIGTYGSADLVLSFWLGERRQALILIENKIDAAFTPDQPARYALCRDAHLARQGATRVGTVLIAPARYLAGSALKAAFDGELAYEELSRVVAAEDAAAAQQHLAAALQGSGLYMRTAGDSLALVADTQRLDNHKSAHAQREAIVDALQKLRVINEVWNGMEEPLREFAARF